MKSMLLILVMLDVLVIGCGGKLPETSYYNLAPPEVKGRAGDGVLVIEPLQTDAAYDDERIVYRTNPFRFDYYQYHRWSAAPGMMVTNYLERALEHTGQFRSVVREVTQDAPVILGGRVVAIEEVDQSLKSWSGHIVVELTLTDTKTGVALWSEQFEENEPLAVQTPEGLAKALSVAMNRIVARAAPVISDLGQKTALAHVHAPTVTGRLAP
jgi:ABC-type uncharacterized transport system auxiliary subunit